MKLLVVASVLVAAVSAAPSGGYGAPPVHPIACSHGQVLNLDGSCVTPKVHRQVFVFTPPHRPTPPRPLPPLPKPEVIQNIVFIRVPEQEDVDDIVIPPPQQKNVVFVLNKRKPDQGARVIEVPSPPPSSPDVFFVNFKDGENPTLPGGIDLHTALQNAEHGGGHIIGDFDDLGEGLHGNQNDGFIHDGGVILGGGSGSGFISDDTVTIGGGRVIQPSGLYGAP
ncbi:uncharacterized protein LOC123519638 [Portunus trituberculatus]|uniref:uncharacterized protein LOC123519638 n=1 Tax=Portunus trituberculatus TaxID=210409 RepID=UPI001E1D111F|nr:uncharacterized protein LOC123519638 [Portunus trituberculatus]